MYCSSTFVAEELEQLDLVLVGMAEVERPARGEQRAVCFGNRPADGRELAADSAFPQLVRDPASLPPAGRWYRRDTDV